MGLVDYDIVEENNLHRQLLHNEDQLGKPKVASAVAALKKWVDTFIFIILTVSNHFNWIQWNLNHNYINLPSLEFLFTKSFYV